MAMPAYGPPPPYGAQPNGFPSHPPPPQMPPHPQWTVPPRGPYNAPPPQQPMPPAPQHHQQPPPNAYHAPPPPPSHGPEISPTPILTFTGPTSTSILSSSTTTISLSGQPLLQAKTSKHSKPHLTLTRLSTATPIGTATYSSLTSSITLHLPAQDLTLKLSTDLASLNGAKKLTHPLLGPLRWRANGAGDGHELRDPGNRVLARYKADCLGVGKPVIEVFVKGDEALVDFVLLSAVAVVKGEEREVKQVMKVLGDVL